MKSLLGGDVAAQTWNGNPTSKITKLVTTAPSTEDYVNVFGPSAYNFAPDIIFSFALTRSSHCACASYGPDGSPPRKHTNMYIYI